MNFSPFSSWLVIFICFYFPAVLFIVLFLILYGVFMMRWNIVFGGQAFSLSFAGFKHYHLTILPAQSGHLQGWLLGALTVASAPFILFWIINKIVPSLMTA